MEDVGTETSTGLIETQLATPLTRRDFARRAAIAGLAVPTIGGFLAACGGDDEDADDDGGSSGTDAGTDITAAGGGSEGGTIRVATQKPAGALDPVAMQDLGSYGMLVQSFEFLTTLGDDDIAPGLATEWSPNEDGSVWTFKLRPGVTWQSGGDFTSADVAATMDRLVEAGNSALKGVIETGAVDTTDPLTAVFTLAAPKGNFPYLVSVFNAQAVITKADWTSGTTLDAKPDGTGPWKLESYDPNTGARFVKSDTYDGTPPKLDAVEFQFFTDLGTQVTAVQGGAVDVITQFQVIGGDALFNDPNFNVLGFRAATHRQIWMRVDEGAFADKAVRQAVALAVDRDALVETLFRGQAEVGNDHVIAPIYPYFDSSVPQRTRDVEAAKELLGGETLDVVLHAGDLQEIPQLAELLQVQLKEASINVEIALESLDTFYGAQWCPAEPAEPPCSGAAEFGIVDYGHRSTPDVYLNAALSTNGIWNSSQYASDDFMAAFTEFQAAIGVDAQKAACTKIQTILNEDVPVCLPYWYNYISGHTKAFTGVRVSALGQVFLDQASAV